MPSNSSKIALGFALLVVVWIGVYWWWDPKPPITFAQAPVGPGGAELEPEPIAREPLVTTAEPPTPAPNADGGVKEDSRRAIDPPEYFEYTIQPGDTLASLGRKFFGSASKGDSIARMNPTMSPPNMRVGRVIRIPKDPSNIQGKLVAKEAEGALESKGATVGGTGAAQEHVVVKGETISGIAKRYYGSSHPRYVEKILDANKSIVSAPEDLKPRQTLKIPPK